MALVGLFLWVTACTSYKQIELGEVADHGKVRVTLTDGERETIRDPRIVGDLIVGGGLKMIPLVQVAELEAVSIDEVGTILTVLAVAVVIGAAVSVIGFATCGDSCPNFGTMSG